jgi:hypothetical protein
VGAAVATAAFILCAGTMRQRLAKLGILMSVALAIIVLCTVVFICVLAFSQYPGSIWMPRYLGVVWPAVAIAAAALLLRLPTRAVQYAAIALVVGVNLSVFSARVFAGSEVPTGLMAQDLIDSQPDDADVRLYYAVNVRRSGEPGSGYLSSVPGAYYLTILSGRDTSPDEMISSFHGGRFERNWRRWSPSAVLGVPTSIFNDLRRRPNVKSIMVWENFRRGQYNDADPVADKLGDGWRRVGEQIFPVRDHWTWRNMMTLRRRVYERTGAPTTVPATGPATTQVSR